MRLGLVAAPGIPWRLVGLVVAGPFVIAGTIFASSAFSRWSGVAVLAFSAYALVEGLYRMPRDAAARGAGVHWVVNGDGIELRRQDVAMAVPWSCCFTLLVRRTVVVFFVDRRYYVLPRRQLPDADLARILHWAHACGVHVRGA